MEQDSTGAELPGASAGSLASIVATDGPLPFADVLGLGADVADGLADRHDGEAHGAVSARAIVRGGDGPWVLAAPGLAAGTKPALAPELADGGAPTPAGDVFALGAVLVFALTGQEFVDGALGAGEPAAEPAPGNEGADGGDAATGATPVSTGPKTLQDAMATFLDVLRRTLATDPATRGTAARLAGTLRQLRNDAERAMAPAADLATRAPTGAVAAGAVAMSAGTAAAATRAIAAETDGGATQAIPLIGADGLPIDPIDPAGDGEIKVDGTVDGTDPAAEGTSFKQRLPTLVAVAAVLLVLILGFALLRKGDKPSAELTATGVTTSTPVQVTTSQAPVTVIVVGTDAPTSTSTTTTTTKKATTTTTAPPAAPVTDPPPTTVPAGTMGATVDMSHNTSCSNCPAALHALSTKTSAIVAQVPDKTVLYAKCWTTGDDVSDSSGFTSTQWLFVTGPVGQGWIPVTFVGRGVPGGLPACPQAPTTTATPPTTPPPTTVPPTTSTSSTTTSTVKVP